MGSVTRSVRRGQAALRAKGRNVPLPLFWMADRVLAYAAGARSRKPGFSPEGAKELFGRFRAVQKRYGVEKAGS